MTISSDLLDPIKFYNINEKNYDKNFMDLFKHIIKLVNTNCIQIKEITQEIQKPPITYIKTSPSPIPTPTPIPIPIPTPTPTPEPTPIPTPEPTIDLDKVNELKQKLKKITLNINDLIKMCVKLYNLIKKTEATVKHNVYEIKYILDNPNKDSTGKIALDYLPISINEINIEFIDNLDIGDLIKVGHKLIEISGKYKQNIGYWLKYSEKLHEYFDSHKITADIYSQIVQNPSPQVGGDPPKVSEVYDNLNKIRNYINGITQLDVEFEIPYGTSLKWEDYKKNLLVLQNNLEKILLNSTPEGTPLNQNVKLNLFEKMPDYIGLPEKFFSELNPEKKSDLPEESIELKIDEKLITYLDKKKDYYDVNLTKLKELYNEIIDFLKKINAYKANEMTKYTKQEIVYPFTDIGLKTDIEKEIQRLEEENIANQTKLKQSEQISKILNENIEYIKNKRELEKIDVYNLKENISNLIKNINKFSGQSLSLENYNEYFKFLKTTKKQKIGTQQPVQSWKKQTEKKDSVPETTYYPDYEEGIFLKFDSNKSDNIFKLLDDKNFKNSEELLKKIHTTINFISDDNEFVLQSRNRYPLYNATNENKNENKKIFEKIFQIIAKTTANDKSQNLKKFNNEYKQIIDVVSNFSKLQKYEDTQELSEGYKLLESEKIDFDNLDIEIQKYNEKVTKIKSDIESNTKNIEDQKEAQKNISDDDLNLSNAFKLTAKHETKIKELEGYIKNLNNNLSGLLIESSNLKEILPNWSPLQKGGAKYKENLENLNKLPEINEKIRELLIILETYKSNATDLINKYNEFVRESYSILVYLRYKLLAFDAVKNNIQIDFKFNESILNGLKNKISSKNRKNFGFIKELYINIINDIIEKLGKSGNKFIDYKSYTNKEALINIIILVHLNINIDKY